MPPSATCGVAGVEVRPACWAPPSISAPAPPCSSRSCSRRPSALLRAAASAAGGASALGPSGRLLEKHLEASGDRADVESRLRVGAGPLSQLAPSARVVEQLLRSGE